MLQKISPIAYVVVKSLEAKRGSRYKDVEIEEVVKSGDFRHEYGSLLSIFCSQPANEKVLACVELERRL